VEVGPPFMRTWWLVLHRISMFFPVAEEKVASVGVGVTGIFFVRLAGRIVKRVFNLVTFLKLCFCFATFSCCLLRRILSFAISLATDLGGR